MQTLIKKINISTDKRVLFISDIHADLSSLKKLLKKVNFTFKDYLFLLGDLIEKGQESLATLDYIMSLNENNNVYIVKGNCDEVLENVEHFTLKDLKEYKTFKNKNSILNEILNKEALEVDELLKEDLIQLIQTKYSKYYNFLKEQSHVIILNDIIYLSHSGIDDIKNISTNKEDVLKNQYFYEKIIKSPKLQIVGHLPVFNYNKRFYKLDPIIDLEKNVISIDGANNISNFFQLNALILDNLMNMNFSAASYDNYKLVKVIDDFKGNEKDSFNLRFGKYYVDILKKEDDFYKGALKNNQKELYIHKSHISYDHDNKPFLCDGTNLFLTLKKGEQVALCLYAKPYSYIKKDNIVALCLSSLLEIKKCNLLNIK